MEQIIAAGLEELGLMGRVPEDAPAQLAQYGRMLLEKNQMINLTAIRARPSSTWAPGPVSPAWC